MAAFSDQFSRRDPLQLQPFGLFRGIIYSLLVEARILLPAHRTIDELTVICQQVERVITESFPNPSDRSGFLDDELAVIYGPSTPLQLEDSIPFVIKP